MTPERTAARLARQQHGVVTCRQLRALGWSTAKIRGRLGAGLLEQLHPTVLRFVPAPVDERQLVMAACLAAGPAALASHRSAAMLWDLDIGQVGPEITVRATQRIELAGVIVHRSSRTWGATHRAGVPTTEPLRLLMELGSQTTAAELEAAVDQLVERRLVTWATVERTRASESRQGRRGLGAIGRLLEDRITRLGPTDSKLEADFARLLRRAHLHEAVLHPTIRIGARTIVPDFAFLAERVLIELDGFAFHGDRAAFERDRDRDVIAAADGWLVLRFTWRQVGEQPGEVIARIRAVLASRRELRSHATA